MVMLQQQVFYMSKYLFHNCKYTHFFSFCHINPNFFSVIFSYVVYPGKNDYLCHALYSVDKKWNT